VLMSLNITVTRFSLSVRVSDADSENQPKAKFIIYRVDAWYRRMTPDISDTGVSVRKPLRVPVESFITEQS